MAVLNKLNQLARTLGTGGSTETSKLNSKISSEENAIGEVMKQIGEFYYKKYTETGKADKDIAEFCATIDGHNKAIAEANAEIDRLRAEKEAAAAAATGGIVCSACGTANEADKKFCSECGGKLEAPAPAAAGGVICSACGTANEAGKKFCSECGGKLEAPAAADGVVCSACGTVNEAGKKFCSDCGGKLEAAATSETNKRICACGAEVAPGVKFCTECGAKFEQEDVK